MWLPPQTKGWMKHHVSLFVIVIRQTHTHTPFSSMCHWETRSPKKKKKTKLSCCRDIACLGLKWFLSLNGWDVTHGAKGDRVNSPKPEWLNNYILDIYIQNEAASFKLNTVKPRDIVVQFLRSWHFADFSLRPFNLDFTGFCFCPRTVS